MAEDGHTCAMPVLWMCAICFCWLVVLFGGEGLAAVCVFIDMCSRRVPLPLYQLFDKWQLRTASRMFLLKYLLNQKHILCVFYSKLLVLEGDVFVVYLCSLMLESAERILLV